MAEAEVAEWLRWLRLRRKLLILNSRELNAQLEQKDTSFPTFAAEITVKLTGDLHKKNFVMPTKR